MRYGRYLILAALLTGVLGCGTEPDRKATPAITGPSNTTPEGAVQRLEWAYENKKTQDYEDMLTGDFRFEFSNATDPDLAQEWGVAWCDSDEVISARHLHQGGTNLSGSSVIAATRIEVTLATTMPVGDASEGRDTTRYKVLATRVDGEFEVPENPSDPTIYLCSNNYHRIFLVRGDAAVGLSERQPADSAHWYVWKWKDETNYPSASPGLVRRPSSWARLKVLYR